MTPTTPSPAALPRTRLVIADDHRVVRYSLAGMLGRYADLDLVAEAADGRQAVDAVRRMRPHVVVMDVGMPRSGGVEATRLIRRMWPGVRVVAFSLSRDERTASDMLEAGATAFVSKDDPIEELVSAIRGV